MHALDDTDADLVLGPLQASYEKAKRRQSRKSVARSIAILVAGAAILLGLRGLIEAWAGPGGWKLVFIGGGAFLVAFTVAAALVQSLFQGEDLDVDEDALRVWLQYVGPRLRTAVEQDVLRDWLRHQPKRCTYGDLRALMTRLSSARKVSAIIEEATREAPRRAAAAGIELRP